MNDSPGWASPGSSPSEGAGGQAGQGGTGGQGTPEGIQPPAQPAADSKWSDAQPPPGQWSSPGAQAPAPTDAAPPQQPQGGWGSYGPQPGQPGQPGQAPQYGSPYGGQYGYPGGPAGPWGPPPAAKPGVIPLRPLGLGELLDGAVSTMRTHWRSVLSVSLVVGVLIEVGNVLINKFALADLTTASATGEDPEQVFRGIRDAVVPVLANGFLQLVLGILASALLTVIYSRAVIGRQITLGEAWREARPRLLPLAGLTVLLAAGAVVLFAALLLPGVLMKSIGVAVLGFLVSVPLFVWLWFRFLLASPALMLERAGIFTALKRSDKLVKGSWWRIFGITLLTGFITGIVSMVIAVPFTLLAVLSGVGDLSGFTDGSFAVSWSFLLISGIGSIISFTVILPISAGITVLLYIDQRIRREALDLELARAAGLQHYGSAGAGYGG
ncbi:glycerophosphoryl diester phosphodiesterase membrane domain-containing protein [Streptomyces sp. NPDC046557]|uniref:glycerophosphoryl diester phosphodiesterase membrane domain-containing protein n=1 Tax=Streptomyces sp. NPDC046557 TaxID=3155372 RepID=UPI0033E28AC0